MNSQKKKKLWILTGISLLGMVLVASVVFRQDAPIQAETEKSTQGSKSTSETSPTKEVPTNLSIETRDLEPVENEEGLKATPKILVLAQGAAFPSLTTTAGRNMLFSEVVIPQSQYGASYKYVDIDGNPVTPSSADVGFQMIYVEITENYDLTSIRVPVPVNVTDTSVTMLLENKIALQADYTSSKIVLYPEEIQGKTEEQLQELVRTKANVRAWNGETGEDIPSTVTNTTIVPTSVGTYKATLEATFGSGEDEERATAVKDVVVFGANPLETVAIAQNGTLTLSTNPTNLFSKFQTLSTTVATNATYQFVDENDTVLTKFDTSQVGFKWAYVKMTEKTNTSVTTTMKVPVNVTSADTTALLSNKVMVKASKPTLYPNETKGKTKEELLELIESKSNLSAWNMTNGEEIPVSYTDTTTVNNTVGSYTGTITIDLDGTKATTTRAVTVFGADIKTPYYFTVIQNSDLAMGTNAANIFSKYQTATTTTSSNATYEWVADEAGTPMNPANKFDSSKAGFQWGYIKMTEKTNTAISTIIPVPVTVTIPEGSIVVGGKAGLSYDLPIITVSDIKGKSVSKINTVLAEKLALKAWDLKTGESLDTQITESTITQVSRGSSTITVSITMGEEILTQSITVSIVSDEVFGSDDINDWKIIPAGTDASITNPINKSKMGFPGRGMPMGAQVSELAFVIRDSAGTGYIHGQNRVSDVPGMNNTTLYKTGANTSLWSRYNGLGWDYIGSPTSANNKFTMSATYFLQREDGKLKQIIVDSARQVLYVYDLSLSQNLNFSVRLDMYNTSESSQSLSMLESVDTNYYSDSVPLYALGDNAGFYIQYGSNKFTIRMKDSRGNWLSDYTKYYAGSYGNISDNYFGNSFTNASTETKNYAQGAVIASGVDSAYQLGAPWKTIEPDKALKTGYEVFAGAELPLMALQTTPATFNIYQDNETDLTTDYKLTKIPAAGNNGKIYITYPDESETTLDYVGNSSKEANGTLTIPRATLPEQMNNQPGTIKNYGVAMLAVDETVGSVMKGLPSNDYSVSVNVYNLGATPIAQNVKKGSSWTKAANAIVKDGVILPGHTAKYEYVNPAQPVDTSQEGLQFAEVKMTDINEPTRTTIIKVPVMVIDGTVPSTGVMVGAVDFRIQPEDVADLSDNQLKELILEKSNAIGWDVATGSSTDVELSVTATTLTNTPEIGENYTATIQAKKGTTTKNTTINISVGPNSAEYSINFVDEKGNTLHSPYIGSEQIGTTVKLDELTEVQDIVDGLKANNFDLVESPENDLLIASGTNSVTYKFTGTLKLLSAPNILDFDIQKVSIKAEKFKNPEIKGDALVISDTRADLLEWNLKAKLDQPLTSLENEDVIIPDSIKYNNQDGEVTITDEDTVIFSHTNTASGKYNVTQERWSKGDGFLIDLAPGAVKMLGKYQAKMTITLENAK